MSHLTLQHVEIAIAVFQGYASRFPDATQDVLQNIWREKQKALALEEEKAKLEEAEKSLADAEKCLDEAEGRIASMKLEELAKE